MKQRQTKLSMLILLMWNFNAATLAAGPGEGPASVNEIASYQAQDRQERLVHAGKKEGEVSVYHSIPIEDMTVITAAFTKKYGIKVKLWRSGGYPGPQGMGGDHNRCLGCGLQYRQGKEGRAP